MSKYSQLPSITRNLEVKPHGLLEAVARAVGVPVQMVSHTVAKQYSLADRTRSRNIPMFTGQAVFLRQGDRRQLTVHYILKFRNYNWLDFGIVNYPELRLNLSDRDGPVVSEQHNDFLLSASAGLAIDSAINTHKKLSVTMGHIKRDDPERNIKFLKKMLSMAAAKSHPDVSHLHVEIHESKERFSWSSSGWSGKGSVDAVVSYRIGEMPYVDKYSLTCTVNGQAGGSYEAKISIEPELPSNLPLPDMKATLSSHLYLTLEK